MPGTALACQRTRQAELPGLCSLRDLSEDGLPAEWAVGVAFGKK